MSRILLYLVTLVLCVTPCRAIGLAPSPANQLPITNISVTDGLTNSFILATQEDRHGAIWLLTEAGINRITSDGCTTFTSANSSLPAGNPNGIYYHRPSDQLWIFTSVSDGVAIDCSSLQVITPSLAADTYQQTMVYAADAADGGVWCAFRDGTIQHQAVDGRCTLYSPQTIEQMPTNLIRFLIDDGHNHLYVGYNNFGMLELDIDQHTAKHFLHNPADPHSLPGNNVRIMVFDQFHNIWVGTNLGLALFDAYEDTFTVVSRANGFVSETSGNNIMGLCLMDDGTLWCSSEPGGISILDLSQFGTHNPELVPIQTLLPDNSQLSSPHTRTLLQDHFGNIWIGHYGTGIDVIESIQSPFHILSEPNANPTTHATSLPLRFAYGITKDSQQNLWIGGCNTLYRCHDNQIVEQLDFSPYIDRPFGKTYLTYCDQSDRIWLGIDDVGVLCYDSHAHQFIKIQLFEEFIDVHGFLNDSQGRLWIGTEQGVALLDGHRAISQPHMLPVDKNHVIFALQEDALGRIWIGTFGSGVFIYNPADSTILSLGKDEGLPDYNINQIFKDANGGFWIATRKGLSYLRHPEQNLEIENLGRSEGLVDVHIRSVQQDQMGQIWVSTNTTISCWNQRNHRFSNYDYHNGIPNGGFIEGSSTILADGTLYFVSTNGICYFQPRLVADHQELSPVEIRQFDASENYHRIDFSVSNYAQRNLVEYAYQMIGLDDDWHDTQGDTKVIFRNLSPGKYTFRVKAYLRNGDTTNYTIAEVPFAIQPPMWLTWWALLLYLLLGLAILAVIIYYYLHKVKLETYLKAEEKRREDEHQLNEERMRFYTNITHELRTPLTLILGPLEDLENDSHLAEPYHHQIQTINASAKRLLNLISQLLEFRKTETQNRKLCVAKGDLRKTVREVALRYEELNRNRQVAIRASLPAQFDPLYYDAEVVTTILNNLLSNAMKYTTQGEIRLSLELQTSDNQRFALLRVQDTGYGIAPEALPHIFERYYQASGKHQASGSGIGLAIVRSLVQLHHGQISVESQLGAGTTFSLLLPFDDTYPDELHKESPVVPAALSDDKLSGQVETSPADTRPILLVVEDNDDIRQYILESFDIDFQVLQAANGRAGLDTALRVIPDIIVSDIMMPEMDGIELCKAIKSDLRTSHIPVILLTAKDTIEDKEVGYDSGADSYLTKPFSAKLLHSRIQNLITSRRRLAERLIEAPVDVASSTPDVTISAPSAEAPDPAVDVTLSLNPLDVKFLENLNAVIDQNLSSERLDIALLTDRLNMSNSTLYRKVKALTDRSPNEYIRHCRLLRAKEMLLSGKYNVTETAYETGFSTPNYFRDCFKAAFGIAPSEFLKQGSTS